MFLNVKFLLFFKVTADGWGGFEKELYGSIAILTISYLQAITFLRCVLLIPKYAPRLGLFLFLLRPKS